MDELDNINNKECEDCDDVMVTINSSEIQDYTNQVSV